MKRFRSHRHTICAATIGYATQAIVNNFAPLLFVFFQSEFQIPWSMITILITVNFLTQLCVDLIAAVVVDKIGYRPCCVFAHTCCALGLIGLGILPYCFSSPFTGLLIAVFLYAIGGGLVEVIISPLVEACPTKQKSSVMGLLHSFYCWGQVAVILLSTVFFLTIGIENWRILSRLWAIVPLFNAVYFLFVPIYSSQEAENKTPLRSLFRNKLFWIFALLMFCAGAAELSVAQWASAFAETGLNVSKTVGDLLGPCLFALLMGISRILYAQVCKRFDIKNIILISAILCLGGYLLTSLSPIPALSLLGCGICGFAVGVFWPGTYSVAAKEYPSGGTTMFALLALAGDLGCSGGPTMVGLIADLTGELKFGLLAATIFPILSIVGIFLSKKNIKSKKMLSNSFLK